MLIALPHLCSFYLINMAHPYQQVDNTLLTHPSQPFPFGIDSL
jgi:hypothetical protein